MEVNQCTPPLALNHLHRAFNGGVTIADGRSEDIAHQAVRVHTNQHRFAATFSIASNQRDMRLASIHFAFVSNYAEFTMAGAHQRLPHAVHITLVLHAITDQLRDRKSTRLNSSHVSISY